MRRKAYCTEHRQHDPVLSHLLRAYKTESVLYLDVFTLVSAFDYYKRLVSAPLSGTVRLCLSRLFPFSCFVCAVWFRITKQYCWNVFSNTIAKTVAKLKIAVSSARDETSNMIVNGSFHKCVPFNSIKFIHIKKEIKNIQYEWRTAGRKDFLFK